MERSRARARAKTSWLMARERQFARLFCCCFSSASSCRRRMPKLPRWHESSRVIRTLVQFCCACTITRARVTRRRRARICRCAAIIKFGRARMLRDQQLGELCKYFRPNTTRLSLLASSDGIQTEKKSKNRQAAASRQPNNRRISVDQIDAPKNAAHCFCMMMRQRCQSRRKMPASPFRFLRRCRLCFVSRRMRRRRAFEALALPLARRLARRLARSLSLAHAPQVCASHRSLVGSPAARPPRSLSPVCERARTRAFTPSVDRHARARSRTYARSGAAALAPSSATLTTLPLLTATTINSYAPRAASFGGIADSF